MKKHVFGKVVCLFMSVAMAFGLAACDVEGETPSGDTTQYTVTFDLNGHGAPQPAAQKVDKGGYAKKPETDPSDSDYNFDGWYKEAAGTNEFKFAEEKIEKDTTVYAKWTAKSNGDAKYTVTFDLNGHGGTAPEAQKVDKGGHATRPETDPTDADYNFVDWYKEAAGTNVFNFATETIETNTTVYAKWTAKSQGGDPSQDTSSTFTGKIYLVGDSTVCSFSDEYYIPRYGYGTQINNYINISKDNVVNLAQSGRSSLSFLSEGNYTTLTRSISSGDYLLIGFGHNDEKFEVARYTNPTLSSSDTSTMIGTYDAGHPVSFKYVLKHNYIDVAKAAGATPILCTPITRLYTDDKVSNYDTVHTTTTKTAEDATATPAVTTTWTGGDYAEAIRELAQEEGLLCIDLTATTVKDYKTLGYAEAVKYHAATGAKWADESKTTKEATGVDATHTNLYGAKMNAYHIANAIKGSNLLLKANVITNSTKPTYEENLDELINGNYTIPSNGPFNPETDASTFWKGITGSITDSTTQTVYKWYGTTMGSAAKPSNSYFTMTQGSDSNGVTFTLKAENNSKIQSTDDSFGAVFIQVPFKTVLTVTADATVTSVGGNQSGFGLMIRDDITIDKNQETKSNYVSAGYYVYNSGKSAAMGYARNAGALQNGTNATSLPQANDVLALSLARTSQSITATTKVNGDTYTYNAVSDFDLAASDSEYVYICLWVSRGMEVTFSNITFTSGDWVDA